MRLGSSARVPSRPGTGDGWPAGSVLPGAIGRGPAHVRVPWGRRRSLGGCLFDPGGPCVLSSLLAGAEAGVALDDLLAAMAAEAQVRFEGALRDRVVGDESLAEALIALRALERWLAHAGERRRRRALAGVAAAFASSAYTVPLCLLSDAPVRLTVGVATAVLTAGSALSLLAFLRRAQSGWPLPQLIAGLLCGTGVGILLIVEGAMGRVLVGDEVATLIGLAATGVSLLIQAVVARLADQPRAEHER
jgi:hypothetical protein